MYKKIVKVFAAKTIAKWNNAKHY